MARSVSPRKVARLQELFLRRQGATPEEIRRYAPILHRQIGAESRFQTNLGSPAGARDVAQFMPDTARSYGVTLGDNRIRDDIRGQVRMMLPLLRQHGIEGALRGYNAGPGAIEASKGYAETNAYVKKILRGADPGRAPASGGGSFDGSRVLGSAPMGIEGGSEGLLPLLEALGSQSRGGGGSSLPAPAHAAVAAMPAGSQVPQSGGGPAPTPTIDALMERIRTVGGDAMSAPGQPLVPAPGDSSVSARGGRVVLDPNADRPGVRTKPYVVDAARRVSAIAGRPVRIGTGTRHSRLTVNGNVSDHWDGDAADIPASGRRLIALGQAALIDAGMDPKKARKETGGLYNVNGAQIIFNTDEGGDHRGHLHYRPRKVKR